MKKIGVISDIHGNYPALVEVLAMLDEIGCDEIIHTGDVVDIGPDSCKCMEVLLSRKDITLLLGNHDRDFLLNQATARNLSHVPTQHKEQVFASMMPSHREQVARFPLYTYRTCGGQSILFCHYAFNMGWKDISVFPFKPLLTQPTAEQFDQIFAGIPFDAVFFGHKHEPCDLQGERLYVDVGSVGCHPEPNARAVVISYDDEHWSYQRYQTPYDMQQVQQAMLTRTACGKQLYDFYFLRKSPQSEEK